MKITIDTTAKTIEAVNPVKLEELRLYLGEAWREYSIVPSIAGQCDGGLL